MKRLIAIVVTVALLAFEGCGSAMQQVSAHRYPATPVGSVQVLYQEPQRPYEVIALVSHMNGFGLPISREIAAIREQAAQLGADAVLVTDAQPHIAFSGENVKATGKAIRWTR